ncbi:hypothetical protein BFV93_4792 [Alteromonas macleodii]|nr:hypothetical protein BFV93_4792 [Alteromonas macleodii]
MSSATDIPLFLIVLIIGVLLIMPFIWAHFWVSYRGLNNKESNAFKLLLSQEQQQLIRSVRLLSGYLWESDHDTRHGDKPYSALELETIEFDRDKAEKLRWHHRELTTLSDKAIVQSMRVFESMSFSIRIDANKRCDAYIDYLKLCQAQDRIVRDMQFQTS